ncbi:MAG: pantetheine-phosphate adenylyltransferase [Luteitalea sp.]|nr:pantetheine-phosphate adenylyltransferase [Luteitalea sp.]
MAICPGSFDPLTNGHVDMISRATRLFDRIVVAVLVHPDKAPLFSVEQRVAMTREVFREQSQVEVDAFDGLLVEYARRRGAQVVVRGLRAVSDFEYEMQMAHMNRRLEAALETVFMMPSEAHSYLSSRLVKEIHRLGGDVSAFVPPTVQAHLIKTAPKGAPYCRQT